MLFPQLFEVTGLVRDKKKPNRVVNKTSFGKYISNLVENSKYIQQNLATIKQKTALEDQEVIQMLVRYHLVKPKPQEIPISIHHEIVDSHTKTLSTVSELIRRELVAYQTVIWKKAAQISKQQNTIEATRIYLGKLLGYNPIVDSDNKGSNQDSSKKKDVIKKEGQDDKKTPDVEDKVNAGDLDDDESILLRSLEDPEVQILEEEQASKGKGKEPENDVKQAK